MIWHNTIRKNAHRNPGASQPNQLHEGLVIAGLVKDCVLRVTAIDDVIADAANCGAPRAWHTALYVGQRRKNKEK